MGKGDFIIIGYGSRLAFFFSLREKKNQAYRAVHMVSRIRESICIFFSLCEKKNQAYRAVYIVSRIRESICIFILLSGE